MNQGEGPNVPPRLQAVGKLLAEGRNNQEIADELTIELHTAEKYVSDLKKELNARDRVDLALTCKAIWGAGSH